MSILEIFKSNWSAKVMTDDDRQKLFWYQKRKSSITAWRKYYEAYIDFVRVVELQYREEPVAGSVTNRPGSGTHWGQFYARALLGQVHFEDGLERLSHGERAVWIDNDLGTLHKASIIAETWYTDLVNHGMRNDVSYEGKYVAEMTLAIAKIGEFARATAGLLQSHMADAPAPDCFSRAWIEELEKYVQLPDFLPDVPVHVPALSIRSGEIVPAFGIYEPQVTDGCMNYLLANVPAPAYRTIDEKGVRQSDVVWRLLWQDDRYLDGAVPADERRYFVQQPASSGPPENFTTDLLAADSNQKCPKSGVWSASNDINVRSRFDKGETLPAHLGQNITWVWSADE